VIGFMSGNQQNPDIMCEVFIVSGTDLVDDEIRDGGGHPKVDAEAFGRATSR